MGKRKRLERKARRSQVEPLRRKLLLRAVLLMAKGHWQEGLALGVLAGILDEGGLNFLLALPDEELLQKALPTLELAPTRQRRPPPPWGWTFLQEVVEAYRPPRFGGEGASEVYLALVRTAHFSPLYRAQLIRAAWDLWGSYDRSRFEEFLVALDRKATKLEPRPPFRGRAV